MMNSYKSINKSTLREKLFSRGNGELEQCIATRRRLALPTVLQGLAAVQAADSIATGVVSFLLCSRLRLPTVFDAALPPFSLSQASQANVIPTSASLYARHHTQAEHGLHRVMEMYASEHKTGIRTWSEKYVL